MSVNWNEVSSRAQDLYRKDAQLQEELNDANMRYETSKEKLDNYLSFLEENGYIDDISNGKYLNPLFFEKYLEWINQFLKTAEGAEVAVQNEFYSYSNTLDSVTKAHEEELSRMLLK